VSVYKKMATLLLVKKGVNLDLNQFMIILSNKIISSVLKKKPFKLEIGFKKYAIIDKSTAFCLKLKKGDKEILLDYNSLKK